MEITALAGQERPTEPGPDAGEDALVERARQGDAAAYEALVRRHQQVVFRTAYLIAGSASEAEDISQDAFVRAFYALPRFRAGAPFRPWILQIVANEARNHRRSAGRRAALALRATVDPLSPTTPAPAPLPESQAIMHEEHQSLLAALDTLRDDDRRVIAFRYLLDLSEAETAAALQCPRGTVKSRLSRALDRLRHILGASVDRAAGDSRG